jgi:hypothetical protein
MMQGRPTINVNSGAWNSAAPTQTTQPDSRGLTTGNWRGNNTLYTFDIAAGALHAGSNTIDIFCTSGSTGTLYSGYQVYDALDLVTTAAAYTPAIATVSISPTSPLAPNGARTFTAVAKDANGNVIPANFTWSAARGAIDANGNYTAPATPGSDTISVTATSIATQGYKSTSSRASALATSFSGSGAAAITIVAPPSLSSSAVNNGTLQRSMVNTITLSFSTPVTLAPGAITLSLHPSVNGAGPVGTLPQNLTWSTSDGGLTYTVTFSGANTVNGSLFDGVYDLTLHSSLITDAYNQSLAGGDQTLTFHRLFGDADGNGSIDIADLGTFATFYGTTPANPNFPAYLDIDNNGIIDIADLGTFASNYGKTFHY